MTNSKYIFNDGGRSAYFKGTTGDCATRAMAIGLELDYKACYNELSQAHRARTGKKTARDGIYKEDFSEVLKRHGWVWHSAPKFTVAKPVQLTSNGSSHRTDGTPLRGSHQRRSNDSWNSSEKMVYGYWAKAA
jgi:hypothetical protein